MDDIFGYDNFLNEIIWHYQAGTKSKKNIGKKHDIIIQYSKGDLFCFNDFRMKSANSKNYNHIDNYGEKYLTNGQGKRYYLSNGRASDDVWSCYLEKELQLTSTNKERCDYDTQKPKALLERIIKASSNEGDTLADFFCGSGSFGVVAKKLNRNVILNDINPKAIELTKQRLIDATDLFNNCK
jgi:DNA modification methylase